MTQCSFYIFHKTETQRKPTHLLRLTYSVSNYEALEALKSLALPSANLQMAMKQPGRSTVATACISYSQTENALHYQ